MEGYAKVQKVCFYIGMAALGRDLPGDAVRVEEPVSRARSTRRPRTCSVAAATSTGKTIAIAARQQRRSDRAGPRVHARSSATACCWSRSCASGSSGRTGARPCTARSAARATSARDERDDVGLVDHDRDRGACSSCWPRSSSGGSSSTPRTSTTGRSSTASATRRCRCGRTRRCSRASTSTATLISALLDPGVRGVVPRVGGNAVPVLDAGHLRGGLRPDPAREGGRRVREEARAGLGAGPDAGARAGGERVLRVHGRVQDADPGRDARDRGDVLRNGDRGDRACRGRRSGCTRTRRWRGTRSRGSR